MNSAENMLLQIKDSKNQTILCFLGQAGFLVKTKSGKYIGYDMYLSDCVYRLEQKDGLQRLLPQILQPSDIQFDYIVASHSHRDHFDEDSLPQMMANGQTKLFASVSCESETERFNISKKQCVFVKPDDSYSFDGIDFNFVPCDHGSGAPDAVGLVLVVDGIRLYFAGDTCLRLDTAEYIKSFGSIDYLIAPINGAWGNLNEDECAILSNAIKPKYTIPCHYGMFAMHGGNVDLFQKIMSERCPENKVLSLMQGQIISI